MFHSLAFLQVGGRYIQRPPGVTGFRRVVGYVVHVEEVPAKPLRRGTCRNASECNPARNSHVVRVPRPSPRNSHDVGIARWGTLATIETHGVAFACFSAGGMTLHSETPRVHRVSSRRGICGTHRRGFRETVASWDLQKCKRMQPRQKFPCRQSSPSVAPELSHQKNNPRDSTRSFFCKWIRSYKKA